MFYAFGAGMPSPLLSVLFCFSVLFHQYSSTTVGTSSLQSRATAGLIGTTFVFCLPGSRGACRDAWEGILTHQLDYRHKPCNFVELMPRLDER